MSNELTIRGEALLDPGFCDQAMKLAMMMAKAETLPAHLKGKPADILRVIEMAHRAGQSPFAVADKTYFVAGKIAFEGQLVAGLINAHPLVEERLDYAYEGDEDKPTTLKCTVSARLRGESKRREVKVTWIQGDAQSKGAKDKWKSQPAQQLAYYGARVWARRHAPEILLGLYTPEEIETQHIGPDHAVDVTPAATGFGRARFATVDDYDPETGEVTETAAPQPAQEPRQAKAKTAGTPAHDGAPSPAGGQEPTHGNGNQAPKVTKAQAYAARDAFANAEIPDDYFAAMSDHGETLRALQATNGKAWTVMSDIMAAARKRLGMEVESSAGNFDDDIADAEPSEWAQQSLGVD